MLVVSIVTVLIHMVTLRVKDINRLKTLNRSHCFLRKICRKLVLLKTKMFIWTCLSSWILWKEIISHSSLFIHYSILLKTIPILLISLKTFTTYLRLCHRVDSLPPTTLSDLSLNSPLIEGSQLEQCNEKYIIIWQLQQLSLPKVKKI